MCSNTGFYGSRMTPQRPPSSSLSRESPAGHPRQAVVCACSSRMPPPDGTAVQVAPKHAFHLGVCRTKEGPLGQVGYKPRSPSLCRPRLWRKLIKTETPPHSRRRSRGTRPKPAVTSGDQALRPQTPPSSPKLDEKQKATETGTTTKNCSPWGWT